MSVWNLLLDGEDGNFLVSGVMLYMEFFNDIFIFDF